MLKIGLVLSLVYGLVCYGLWLIRPATAPFGDFYGLWSVGRFAATAGAAVYDPDRLHAFQELADPRFQPDLQYPYLYPPTLLFVLVPMGLLPIGLAYASWMAATFAAYAGATLGRHWRSWSGLALLAAPTTSITLIAGQTGFLTAALLVGGMRCLSSAPILGGVLLGLLTYKPQFGLLVPVALLAARQWRAIAAASLTLLTCIAASSAVFGRSIWQAWLDGVRLDHEHLQAGQPPFLHLMPTVAASVQQVTGSVILANGVQVAVALAIAILVWRCFARSIERGIVPLLIGTVLATPYGFVYDLPMIASAMLLEWRWRRDNGLSFELWELAVVVFFFESVSIMSAYSLPLAAPLTLILFMAALMRVRAKV